MFLACILGFVQAEPFIPGVLQDPADEDAVMDYIRDNTLGDGFCELVRFVNSFHF